MGTFVSEVTGKFQALVGGVLTRPPATFNKVVRYEGRLAPAAHEDARVGVCNEILLVEWQVLSPYFPLG